MKIALSDRALATALVVPTVIVVIMLAIVQYRWSEQVSSATSVRLADSLQMSMMSWQLNLFRSLSDLCQRMAPVSNEIGAREVEDLARRFHEQQTFADYPDLVSEVDLMPSDTQLPGLRWNDVAHRFEPLSAPAPRVATMDLPIATTGGIRDWHFDPTVPLLLRPVVTSLSLFDGQSHSTRMVAAWIVMRLNLGVLKQQLLPELARRHFSGIVGLDYQVAVVAGSDPRRVIYSSDRAFAAQEVGDADGELNIFGRPLANRGDSSIHIFQTPSQDLGPPLAVSTAWFSLAGATPPSDDWRLVVRHRRDGALGGFVAQTRRRDLAISFSLLLLLVLSMTVWLIVVNRAQRLANLQMNFVAAVSHDLRTPLTVIASAADNIAHGVVHEREQLSNYGLTIGRQARKLSELVDRVLLFAASRESSPRYSPQPIDISAAIDAALEAAAELIHTSHVVVERNVAGDLPSVTGDPVGLLQCLQNLITNAIKYGGPRPWLGVRAALNADEGRPEIQVSVSDHGIGVSSSDLRHIFTPFYRSPSVADQIGGTGLGLAVARGVVEQMRGRLTVVSVPGEGSTFTLHIPCAGVEPDSA